MHSSRRWDTHLSLLASSSFFAAIFFLTCASSDLLPPAPVIAMRLFLSDRIMLFRFGFCGFLFPASDIDPGAFPADFCAEFGDPGELLLCRLLPSSLIDFPFTNMAVTVVSDTRPVRFRLVSSRPLARSLHQFKDEGRRRLTNASSKLRR